MKLYDISQELFSSNVFPGDKKPEFHRVLDMVDGAVCNLTELSLCAHNGTHVDAPKHFFTDGKAIDEIKLTKCMGLCSVITMQGEITRENIVPLLRDCKGKLLIKGDITITLSAAEAMNEYHLDLIGVESQTVGPPDAPKAVHLELLAREVVLLEGLVLKDVPDGEYFLSAAPLKLGGLDGAPCRAVLIEF